MDKLRKTIIFLVYALFLTAPFVVYHYFPSSRIFQNHFVQIVSFLIAVLFFFYLAFSKKNVAFRLLDVAVLVYLVSILISSITANDYLFSLKESLFPISGILIYFIISRTFRGLSDVKRLCVVLIIGATITSIYGMLQYFNIDFIRWEKSHLRGKFFVIAMLSHPNFVAIYIAPIIPLIIYFIFKSRHISQKIILVLALIINVICLKFTGARGPWLGLVVAFIVSVILYYFLIRKVSQTKSNFKKGLLVLLIVVLFVSVVTIRHKRFSVLERISDTSTVLARFYAWVLATEMIKDKPLLGIGYGNYQTRYFDYVDRVQKEEKNSNYIQFLSQSQARISARTHNDYLQTAAEMGLIGLFAFLFLLVVIVSEQLGFIVKCSDRSLKFLILTNLSSILIILTDAFFNFPFRLPNTQIVFWALVGNLCVLDMNYRIHLADYSHNSEKFKLVFRRAGFLLLFLGAFAGFFILCSRFLSDHYYYLAEGLDSQYTSGKKVLAQKSIDYDSTAGASYMILGTALMKEGDVFGALGKTSRANITYGSVNLLKQYSLIYQRMKNFELAIEYFKKVLRVYPADIDTMIGLGSIYYYLGDYEGAVSEFEKGFVFDPFNQELYLVISEAYVKLGEVDKAVSKLHSVLVINPENESALEKLAMIYIDKNIYLDKAIAILQEILKTNKNARIYASLASAYYKNNDWVNAIRNINRASSLAPRNKKISKYKEFLLSNYRNRNKEVYDN